MTDDKRFLCQAIELARANIGKGGRPFGAVVVKDGEVVAAGVNEIHSTNDPTAHAELTAIRAASRKLGSPDLSGCVVYASGHPCPMCMAAMRLAGSCSWRRWRHCGGRRVGVDVPATAQGAAAGRV